MTNVRTPRQVVELYSYEVWNKRRLELVEELIADELVRHDVGSSRKLTRAEALQRIEGIWSGVARLEFTLPYVISEGEFVTTVWQCDYVAHDGSTKCVSSIEVFRVVEGQITEVWNNQYQDGAWH